MIPIIQQAMVMGYTAEKILSFLGSKIPGMQSGLANAKSRGYSDDDILNFLKNKIPQKDPQGSQKYSNQLDTYLSSNGIQTKEERIQVRNKGIKTALGVAGTAMGAYKAYENYSGIFDQIKEYFSGDTQKQEQPSKIASGPEQKKKSLFERLIGGVDISTLEKGMQKQLNFLMPIAQKLEDQGKDEKDPAVKKLREKIKKVLGGKVGFLQQQAMELDPNTQAMKQQQSQQGRQPFQGPGVNQQKQPNAVTQALMSGDVSAVMRNHNISHEKALQLIQQYNQQQGSSAGPQQPQPQGGQGQAALMAILQKIQAMRGGGG